MQSYFVWNGVDSRAMGIRTRAFAPLVRPEERAAHVQIPGRSGDLTYIEGEGIYNSYIQTVSISVTDGSLVHAVFDWLRGGGYVTFSGEPTMRQPARVIGAVTLERISRNMDHWAGQVQFYCQPLKEKLTDSPVTLTEAATVLNAGDVDAYPVILAAPDEGEDEITITCNGDTLTIANVSGVVRIDCNAREVSNAGRTELLTHESAGPFPVLKPGNNLIGGTGWTQLEITKNERYL